MFIIYRIYYRQCCPCPQKHAPRTHLHRCDTDTPGVLMKEGYGGKEEPGEVNLPIGLLLILPHPPAHHPLPQEQPELINPLTLHNEG